MELLNTLYDLLHSSIQKFSDKVESRAAEAAAAEAAAQAEEVSAESAE